MITFFVSATSSAIGYKTLAARLSTMPTNCDFCEFTANDRCSFRQRNLVVYVEIRYMYDKHVGEYSFDFFLYSKKRLVNSNFERQHKYTKRMYP